MYQLDWPERLEELDIFGAVLMNQVAILYTNEAYGFLKVVPLMDPDRDVLPMGGPITEIVGFTVLE